MNNTNITYKNNNNEYKTVNTVGSRLINAVVKTVEKNAVSLYVNCDYEEAGTITVSIACIEDDGTRIYHVNYGTTSLECMKGELKEAINRAYDELTTIEMSFKEINEIWVEVEDTTPESSPVEIVELPEGAKTTYGMQNITIEPTNNNTYAVYADTKRFGQHEMMFESYSPVECRKYVEDNTSAQQQEYTSANTSINADKIPAVFTKIIEKSNKLNIPENTVIFDNGCGKYTTHISEFISDNNMTYYGRDKYNQPESVNTAVEMLAKSVYNPAVTRIFTSSNVLNVIKGENFRLDYLADIKKYMSSGEKLYITVYEGDNSGIGRKTSDDCWQENRKLKSYINEVKAAGFSEIITKYGMIIATA